MKKLITSVVASFAIAFLVAVTPVAHADRLGGPASQILTVPAYQTVSINVAFVAGAPAVVNMIGNGNTIMDIMMYDADGHASTSLGEWDRRTVSMDVYRTGVFRVEIRNLGQIANTVVLTTN